MKSNRKNRLLFVAQAERENLIFQNGKILRSDQQKKWILKNGGKSAWQAQEGSRPGYKK